MTRNEVLDKLLSKYGKYGYTRLKISGLIKDGEKHGFSYTMIYNGLRMAFSKDVYKRQIKNNAYQHIPQTM